MNLRLFQRRTVWWPTWAGWIILITLIGGTGLGWWLGGEPFLATTAKAPAEVLVVESWIGYDGIRAASAEFKTNRYGWIVSAGGLVDEHWYLARDNYADLGRGELLRSGIAPGVIITAPAEEVQVQRTFESASAVWRALHKSGIQPKSINIFTLGAHARRSRLVYAKVFGPNVRVGVVSWQPEALNFAGQPWWHSSERALDFYKETIGYFFELLLNSGRISNSPQKSPPR